MNAHRSRKAAATLQSHLRLEPPPDLEAAHQEAESRLFARACKAHVRATPEQRRASMGATAGEWLNVVGLGTGQKWVRGDPTAHRAVVVFVQRKLPLGALPRLRRIPASIAGVPTDVVETGAIWAGQQTPASTTACLRNPRARLPRPFPAAVSVGGGRNSAGTLGYPVRCTGSDGEFILSNFHVLGDLDDAERRPVVSQPGWGDGPADPIGELAVGTPIVFESEEGNAMDAALARVQDGSVLPFLCAIGPLVGVSAPIADSIVYMHGKQSGFSKGVVAERGSIWVRYGGARRALFSDQVRIRPVGARFARRGDSGAVIATPDRTACALLFAVDGRGCGWATPIARVLAAFGATLAPTHGG